MLSLLAFKALNFQSVLEEKKNGHGIGNRRSRMEKKIGIIYSRFENSVPKRLALLLGLTSTNPSTWNRRGKEEWPTL